MYPFLLLLLFFNFILFCFNVPNAVSIYRNFKDVNLVVQVPILAALICTFFQFLLFHIGRSYPKRRHHNPRLVL